MVVVHKGIEIKTEIDARGAHWYVIEMGADGRVSARTLSLATAKMHIDKRLTDDDAIAYYTDAPHLWARQALTPVQQTALDIARFVYRQAHYTTTAAAYALANAAAQILGLHGLITDYDYGSPYTSHKTCECETCVSVRSHNAATGTVPAPRPAPLSQPKGKV